MRSARLGTAACLAVLAVTATAPGATPLRFGRGAVDIRTRRGPLHLRVQVATTDRQISRGLMFRRRLDGDGMLFLFAPPRREWFWMKNTLIPLQIAFFDSRGVIIRLDEMRPCRRDPCRHYDPGRPIRGALEVGRGRLTRAGVRVGDTLSFR